MYDFDGKDVHFLIGFDGVDIPKTDLTSFTLPDIVEPINTAITPELQTTTSILIAVSAAIYMIHSFTK
jgi:hypothetical protein